MLSFAFIAGLLALINSTSAFLAPRRPGHAAAVHGAHQKRYDVEVHFVEIPIDHFGDYEGTFKNRYWVNDTYYQPGGPVIFFDAGEEPADDYLPWLQEDNLYSDFMRVAKDFNGLAILWEHRYYGESLPFEININTTKEQWSFLTIDQALEDVVYFANQFNYTSATSNVTRSVHPLETPWIWIGGSYPAERGTLLRIRNPEVIFATWASSAPVHAQVDMSSYWKAAERALPRNCSADWVSATKYADAALRDGTEDEVAELKLRMQKASLSLPGNTTLADQLTLEDVKNLTIEEAGQILLQPISPNYGFFQGQGLEPVLPFCEELETQNFTAEAYKGGLVSTHDPEFVFDAFLVAMSDTVTRNASAEPEQYDPTSWSWIWQFCSEFGYLMIHDPNDNSSIISSFASESYIYDHACRIPFGDKLPTYPQVDHINKYGDWYMNPTRVFFSHGEWDPWKTLSVGSTESNAPMRLPDATIPDCDSTHNSSSYFGATYPKRVHMLDRYTPLNIPDTAFYTSLKIFEMALEHWLPCFGPV